MDKKEILERINTNLFSKICTIFDDLDEYIDNINLDIYEQIAATEREYVSCVR